MFADMKNMTQQMKNMMDDKGLMNNGEFRDMMEDMMDNIGEVMDNFEDMMNNIAETQKLMEEK